MAEVKELSEKAKDVMDAIISNPNSNVTHIAEFLGVSVATVTGSLGTLKKRGYVTVEEGILTPTDEANFEFGTGSPAATPSAPATSAATEEVKAAATEEVQAGTETMIEGSTDTAATIDPEAASEAATDLAAAEANAEHQVELAAELHAEAAHATEVAVAAVTEVVAVVAGKTKAEKARAVFEEMKDKPRKEIMARLMSDEVGLSKNGANTYIYNMRKSAGMVKPRAGVEAAAEEIGSDTESAAPEASGEEAATAELPQEPEAAAEATSEEKTAE